MKRRKLTKEQKKLVWSQPTSNAGAGWQSEVRRQPVDGRQYEINGPAPEPDLPLEKMR